MKELYIILMKNHIGNAKQCKTLIKHKEIIVNGEIETNYHYLVQDNDDIVYHGVSLNAQPFHYYMLNKPKGYISANKDKHYPCVTELLDYQDVSCIGRLDIDTTGLLILTDDHSLIKKLLLPQNHQDKQYFVKTLKPLDPKIVLLFKQGIIIDQHIKCLPSQLDIIDDYHCTVTLQEGKYHQIKKMFLSCHNQVVELQRISFAGISLDSSLKLGQARELTRQERQCLFSKTFDYIL